jgi:hypothetical protein
MKKWVRWLLISIGIAAGVLILFLVIIIIGTKGAILTGGVPLEGLEFSAGGIPGVPVYPDAVQSTESEGVSVPDDMRRVIGTNDDQWKRYLTDASKEEVEAWYVDAMPQAEFRAGSERESGVLLFFAADTRYAIYVTVIEGQTNIIIAAGKE